MQNAKIKMTKQRLKIAPEQKGLKANGQKAGFGRLKNKNNLFTNTTPDQAEHKPDQNLSFTGHILGFSQNLTKSSQPTSNPQTKKFNP
jgi:hypothetical protein